MNSHLGRRRSQGGHQDGGNELPPPSTVSRWWQSDGKLTAAGTLVIAAFTIVLAGVGVLQYFVLVRTDETQRTIQRAFVVPRTINVMGLAQRDANNVMLWQIATNWENTGNTATHNLVIYTTYEMQNSPPIKKPSAVLPNNSPPGSVTIMMPVFPQPVVPPDFDKVPLNYTLLGPHQIGFGGVVRLPGTTMQRLQSGLASLAIIGLATYEDEFHSKHMTMVCKTVSVPELDYLQSEPNNPISTYNPDCKEYNCADSDCEKYKGSSWLPKDVMP